MLSKSLLPIQASSLRLLDRLPQAQAEARTSALIRVFSPLLRSAGLHSSTHFERTGRLARIDFGFQDGTLTVCMDVQDDCGLAAVLNDHTLSHQCALAQLLINPALTPLKSCGLGPAQLCDISTWDGPLPFPTRPSFRLKTTESEYCFVLAQAEPELLACAHALNGRSDWQDSWISSLKLAAVPCLATQRLQTDRLASLRPGDVLLAPITVKDNRLTLTLHCGDTQGLFWCAKGQIDGQYFSIEHVSFMTTEPPQNTSAITLAQLEVPVQLELDPIVLPIAELEDLAPGHTLELASAVDEARIRLTVYGQEIGHGKLVAVGDHLGVQIAGITGGSHGND